MAVRTDFVAGEVLAAQDLDDTFASKVNYALPVNAQTGSGASAYTFVLADALRLTTASNASAGTYTIPPQSSVTWLANTVIRIVNYGAGTVTIAGGAGVTVTNATKTLSQFESAALIRTAENAWTLVPFSGGVDLDANSNLLSFTSSGSSSVPSWAKGMKYLVVGGGQATATSITGGAGGQVTQGSVAVAAGTSLTITVGGSGSNSSLAVSGGSTYTGTAGTGAAGGGTDAAGTNGTVPSAPFNFLAFGGGGGGGGGGGDDPGNGGRGGEGGGGTGSRGATTAQPPGGLAGRNGDVNTGGGGGGGGGPFDDTTQGARGSGGSGIVMIYFY